MSQAAVTPTGMTGETGALLPHIRKKMGKVNFLFIDKQRIILYNACKILDWRLAL